MRPVIHSNKHYVQQSFATVSTVSKNEITIATAVNQTNANAVNEVVEGSVVKAVFVELWLISSAADGSEIVTITKNTRGGTGPTYAEMVALGTYQNKKDVLFCHQGLASNDGLGNPQCAIRGWIKIPKSKQRFGLGDTLNLNIANPSANDLDYCGFITYKEYQ